MQHSVQLGSAKHKGRQRSLPTQTTTYMCTQQKWSANNLMRVKTKPKLKSFGKEPEDNHFLPPTVCLGQVAPGYAKPRVASSCCPKAGCRQISTLGLQPSSLATQGPTVAKWPQDRGCQVRSPMAEGYRSRVGGGGRRARARWCPLSALSCPEATHPPWLVQKFFFIFYFLFGFGLDCFNFLFYHETNPIGVLLLYLKFSLYSNYSRFPHSRNIKKYFPFFCVGNSIYKSIYYRDILCAMLW